jgi:hypothetical protein
VRLRLRTGGQYIERAGGNFFTPSAVYKGEVRTMEPMATQLTVMDAFSLLSAGVPVYIASAPEASNAMPLRGAWKDDEGRIHHDLASVYLCRETALEVGAVFQQECILALTPNPNGAGCVCLLPDTPLNRRIALCYAGGYTADGQHLLTAFTGSLGLPEFVEGEPEILFTDVEFLPVPK